MPLPLVILVTDIILVVLDMSKDSNENMVLPLISQSAWIQSGNIEENILLAAQWIGQSIRKFSMLVH